MYDDNYTNFEFDSNGDGMPDTYVEYSDTNGDGNYDQMMMVADTNGDGNIDTLTVAHDTNNSGQYDTFIGVQDADGDGTSEVFFKAHDYDQDGRVDSVNTYRDTNGDGIYDVVEKMYDSTHDGEMDRVDLYTDTNGSGEPDYHEAYNFDPTTGELVPAMAAGLEVGATHYTELPQFEPDESYPEGISGDPAEAMEHWEYQGDTNRCALFSQKFVIEELKPGTEIDIEEFAAVAKENGWFTEDGGTSLLNMNNMLDYYGIENEMTFHNTVDDIEQCLNDGGKVIVSIDADQIWYGKEQDLFTPYSGSNHAVEVIGIDRTDPEHPMVILNDSGTPNGKGEMIPLEDFEKAWEDGDSQMIKCYPQP
jgi:5-hydroxyisourate hydrolase-like protein (transthyretin family)